MDKIIFVIIGTTHETKQEEKIFQTLNKYIKEYKGYVHWLCEGEEYGRKCISIKDNNVHLLTDTLFVNMLLINKMNNINFYERCTELFVTIEKSEHKEYIKKNNNYFAKIIEKEPDRILYELQQKPKNELIDKINQLCKFIIDLVLEKKIITVNEKCVIDFYKTGYICEDEILTDLREQSFIQHIIKYILWLSSKKSDSKYLLFLTVGCDHVSPIKKFFNHYELDIRDYCFFS